MSSIGGSTPATPDPSVGTTAPVADSSTTTPAAYDLTYAPFAGETAFAEVLDGTRTLGMGAEGPQVKILEETLIALGYGFQGGSRANETLTQATVNAIARFQRDNSLNPSGAVDRDTLIAMDKLGGQRLSGTAPATTEPVAPKPTDFVAASVLEKHGLSATDMSTHNEYEGEEWGSVGYYPYDGDVQYIAFAKHSQVFGNEGRGDAHAYFEFYANPPSGLDAGSWIASGYVTERNFEAASGVDITGSRLVDNAGYKLLREAGAPADSEFALRDKDGNQLPIKDGDSLVPTVLRDGGAVEVTVDGEGDYFDKSGASLGWGADVVWRLKSDGAVQFDAEHKVEGRNELLGVDRSVKFDFLDATGRMVGFNPSSDRIAETWEDDGKWHALNKNDDGTFEHQVIEGDSVTSTEQVDEAAALLLKDGKDVIHRIQTSSGSLKGDGKVGETYDMGWWGKCHNVASLSTTNMDKPKNDVNVILNLEPGDEVAIIWGDNNVMVPSRDGNGQISGYTLQDRAADGTVQNTTTLSVEEATRLAVDNQTKAMVLKPDGSLSDAEVSNFDTESLKALVAHVGDGAVVSKGGEGSRYYAHPDIFVMKDGRQIQGHVTEVQTEADETHRIGDKDGNEYDEYDRSELRGPGMDSRVLGSGGRRHAFNVQDMAKLNEHREDDIKSFKIVHTDGTEETIEASDVDLFAWENKYDFRPDQLWSLHGVINKESSSVIETYGGTQVWNYSATDIETSVLDPATLDQWEKEEAAKPGMMTGTVDDEGKVYFSTSLDTDGGQKDLKYWAKFDAEGEVTDYGYIDGRSEVPDFNWVQHVKKDEPWTGMSQAPGVKNGDIQRLYHASTGRLSATTLPGGFISAHDLKTATPTPE